MEQFFAPNPLQQNFLRFQKPKASFQLHKQSETTRRQDAAGHDDFSAVAELGLLFYPSSDRTILRHKRSVKRFYRN